MEGDFLKIGEVFKKLCEIAPPELAMPYDNSGFLIGDRERNVTKAVVCLDCTSSAIDYAVQKKAELIISHHPIIFSPIKQIVSDGDGKKIISCIENKISVISMHTNLDSAADGVNDCLARAIELNNIKKIDSDDGFSFRYGNLKEEMKAGDFATHVKNHLKSSVRYADSDKIIKTVAVCGGSGGDFLTQAAKNADAFLTADVKHSVFISAIEMGYPLFDGGHYATENVVIEPLVKKLNNSICEVEFIGYNNEKIKSV